MSETTKQQGDSDNSRLGSWLLTWLILAGLVVGAVVGEVLFSSYDGKVPVGLVSAFEFGGNTLFMNLLKMVLVPLVASSVVVGVSSIGDSSKLGWFGGITVGYYFATMVIAVVIGVILVTSIGPGEGIDQSVISQGQEAFTKMGTDTQTHIASSQQGGLWGAFQNIVSQLIPSNPIGAAAEGQLLPVISFSIILGIVLTVLGEKGRPLIAVFDSLFEAMMKLVEWILYLAPIGVFFLVAWTVARIGLQSLIGPLSLYIVTVVVGLTLHALVVLPLILGLITRENPFRYMHQMRTALLTAFTTDSSSATLPVTIEMAETEGGVSPRSARFVLPLGATINMDGTALYEAVAVVFLFQCYGIELHATELAIIVITATLAAIGAAGIPSAGLVTMVIVVQAVNQSLGLSGDNALPLAAVGIILGIDRLLDMCRTTVNVWGDAVGAKVVDVLDSKRG